jgi:hypothetical protein
MCAACVAQGTLYVGGAVGALRAMAARAEMKRRASEPPIEHPPADDVDLEPTVPSPR